ncbi:ribosome biogenesis protein bop1-A-like [Paramacrobiotus metropolitanus]|uniref:ribosome biogenesis protein bop1-A-like n=1 Tax=Paramacrobiotus metropolitanus TaxID=2943436 RepID=UPI0024463715|nr:ribosome biogenesis protein bop1-A-like [Paramacrobiotus metropolitanus]
MPPTGESASKRKWTDGNVDMNEGPNLKANELTDLFVDAPLSDCSDSDREESEDESDVPTAHSGHDANESSDVSDDSSEYSDLSEAESSDTDDDSPTLYSLAEPKENPGDTASLPGRPSTNEIGAVNVEASSLESSTANWRSHSDPAEYDVDSSDEEDIRNTVGNVPFQWYENYPHLGYDWEGKKILKPATGDELEKFLKRMDDPEFWRTVKDKTTGQDVVLTDEDLDIIQKIQGAKAPVVGDPYEPFEDIFSHETMTTSLSSRPPSKRSFLPSLLEKEKISKLVHAIKMGWITPGAPKSQLTEDEKEETYYALWEKEEEDALSKSQRIRSHNHVPAPKLSLPGHAESYNPPPEYMLTDEEKQKWRSEDPEDRKLDFVPRQYNAMRLIPGWGRFIKERFERCLDLYLCPRQRKMKVNVNPEDLIPVLPKPKDLQPFPSREAIVYKGHTGVVRCLSVHSHGQFLASGSDDGTVKIWEISTGRCFRTYRLKGRIAALSWCPKPDVCLLAASVDKVIHFLTPDVGDKLVSSNTDRLLAELGNPDPNGEFATFTRAGDQDKSDGLRLTLSLTKEVVDVTWHPKGDYLATVVSDGASGQVVMHQLSKLRSQMPFKKISMVQRVLFHPNKPFLFVCTQRSVRIYDLSKQQLKKVLQPSCQYISCAAIHPQGDNVLVGSYDNRLCWFDLDASVKPYQTLRHHNKAVRQVKFHKVYPLFASCSDDGSVIISHGMVYNDLNQFPLIVPVKMLKAKSGKNESGLGIVDVEFHPTQPWVFSAGSDNLIKLFV